MFTQLSTAGDRWWQPGRAFRAADARPLREADDSYTAAVKKTSGGIVRLIGTSATIIGALTLLFASKHQNGEEFLVGAVFVLGGLLLRIEAAIKDAAQQKEPPTAVGPTLDQPLKR